MWCAPSPQPLPPLLGTVVGKENALDFGAVRRVSEQKWSNAHKCVLQEPEVGNQVEVTSAGHQSWA